MDMKRYKESTIFLLPLIMSENCYLKRSQILNEDFITTYIKDSRFKNLDNTVVLSYNKSNNHIENFYRFKGKIYDMSGLITYHITINNELQKDYNRILKGEYSDLTIQAKGNIIDFWDANRFSFLYGILFKTQLGKMMYLKYLHSLGVTPPKKSDFEYWRKPDISEETYTN